MRHRWTQAALLATTWLLASCAVVSAPPPVPPLQVETIPNPPVSAEQLIWQPGHWDWTGSGFAWVPGQYVTAAGHGNLWQPGYWVQGPSGFIWQPAHWT
jgi:WXXGXW repeat (2 copies)